MSPPRRSDEFDRMIQRLRSASGLSGHDLRLHVRKDPERLSVSVGSRSVDFRYSDEEWGLEWERLVELVKVRSVHGRLDMISRAGGENSPGAWSVFATAFAIDWLAWNAGGTATIAWQSDVAAILDAADRDGSLLIRARGGRPTLGMKCELRSRRLLATIELGEAQYASETHVLRTEDAIPEIAANARAGRSLGDFVDLPAIRNRRYRLSKITTTGVGTTFTLRERWMPLTPMPESILDRAVEYSGSPLPWDLTKDQQREFDLLESEAYTLSI
jgi:hypothetical protein